MGGGLSGLTILQNQLLKCSYKFLLAVKINLIQNVKSAGYTTKVVFMFLLNSDSLIEQR